MALTGHTILVVEDEPLIALDIVEGLTAPGASVHTAHNLQDGLRLAARPDLSAAIVDFGLQEGEGSALCEQLNARRVPFILHTGYAHTGAACESGIIVPKPATQQEVGRALEQLLQG